MSGLPGTEWGTDYWGEVMSEPSEEHARVVAKQGKASIYSRSPMGQWIKEGANVAKTMAEVIHEAHCLERVHNDDCMFWEDDAVSAAALSAAGYGLVADAKRSLELAALLAYEAVEASTIEQAKAEAWDEGTNAAIVAMDNHIAGDRTAKLDNPYRKASNDDQRRSG